MYKYGKYIYVGQKSELSNDQLWTINEVSSQPGYFTIRNLENQDFRIGHREKFQGSCCRIRSNFNCFFVFPRVDFFEPIPYQVYLKRFKLNHIFNAFAPGCQDFPYHKKMWH